MLAAVLVVTLILADLRFNKLEKSRSIHVSIVLHILFAIANYICSDVSAH